MSQHRITVLIIATLVCLFQFTSDVYSWDTDRLSPTPVINFPDDCISWNAHFSDDRRLMVSDAPEIITTLAYPVLWHDKVSGEPGVIVERHRVFLWHVNALSEQRMKVGITVENLSPAHTLLIADCRVVASIASREETLAGVGIPVAKSGLDIAYASPLTLPNPFIEQASTSSAPPIREVVSWSVDPGQILGALVEFSVIKYGDQPSGDLDYMVRVVVSRPDEALTGNPRLREGTDGSGLYPLTNAHFNGEKIMHTRGSWAHSSITVTNRTDPFIYSPKPKYGFITFPYANDLLMTRVNSYDPAHATPGGNDGNWGVTYKLLVFTTLPAGETRTRLIEMRFIGLHTSPGGGAPMYPYAGAGRVGEGDVEVIPELQWGGEHNSTRAVWIFQTAPGTLNSQSFELMHAGGSCLPVAVRLIGI